MGDRTLNAIAKGAGIVAVGMVFSKLFTYLYRVVVARFIGPDAYGQLSLGITVLSIAGSVSLLAMNQALNKYVAKHNQNNDPAAIRGSVLSATHMVLPLSILAGIAIWFSAPFLASRVFHTPELVPVLKIFAFVPPFGNLSSIFISTMTAFKEMKYRVVTNQIFQPVVQLAATLGFIAMGYGVAGAAGGWLVGVVLSTVLGAYFLEKKVHPIIFGKADPDHRHREMLKYSGPLMFSGIIGSVLGWTDTLFLGYYMTDAQVGFYNAALPTALLILMPYRALKSLALPSLSEVHEDDSREPGKVLKNLSRWNLSVTLPAFIVMALFSGPVLRLLFGAEYTVAGTALALLALGNLFSAAVGPLDEFIKSISRTDLMLKNTVANLVVNIVLNVLLIPVYGIEGAAVATAGSIVFVNLLLIAETYHLEGVLPFDSDSWRPLAASVVPLPVIYAALHLLFPRYIPVWALVPGGLAFGAMYLAGLVLAGGFREEDRDIIVGIGRRIGKAEEADRLADHVIR
ncbi:MAG: flippase [Candidatus Nanohaloarchaea archaeon]